MGNTHTYTNVRRFLWRREYSNEYALRRFMGKLKGVVMTVFTIL